MNMGHQRLLKRTQKGRDAGRGRGLRGTYGRDYAHQLWKGGTRNTGINSSRNSKFDENKD